MHRCEYFQIRDYGLYSMYGSSRDTNLPWVLFFISRGEIAQC